MGASEILRRIGPGQTATLVQGTGNWREVRCERITDDSIQLSIARDQGDGTISFSSDVMLQTIIEGGVARIEGRLSALDPKNLLLGLRFTPSGGDLKVVNRRQSFRVNVAMRGRIRTVSASRSEEEENRSEWECVLKDISVGGAKLVVKQPPPHPGAIAVLELTLPTEEGGILLPCRIVTSHEGRHPPPMDSVVRVAYHELPARIESKLFRFVNWVQLDMIKRGVR